MQGKVSVFTLNTVYYWLCCVVHQSYLIYVNNAMLDLQLGLTLKGHEKKSRVVVFISGLDTYLGRSVHW